MLALVTLVASGCGSDSGGGSSARPSTRPVKPRNATVAVPVVSGPVTGGRYGVPANPVPPTELERFGYREDEYFVAGTARAAVAPGPLSGDGRWSVANGATAPYATRIIVRRPTDPKRFSGTVVVEWMNVTAGRDSDPEFGYLLPALMREGDAYVGVSAQKIGVEGGGGLKVPGVPPEALDRKSTRLNSSHVSESRMPSSA